MKRCLVMGPVMGFILLSTEMLWATDDEPGSPSVKSASALSSPIPELMYDINEINEHPINITFLSYDVVERIYHDEGCGLGALTYSEFSIAWYKVYGPAEVSDKIDTDWAWQRLQSALKSGLLDSYRVAQAFYLQGMFTVKKWTPEDWTVDEALRGLNFALEAEMFEESDLEHVYYLKRRLDPKFEPTGFVKSVGIPLAIDSHDHETSVNLRVSLENISKDPLPEGFGDVHLNSVYDHIRYYLDNYGKKPFSGRHKFPRKRALSSPVPDPDKAWVRYYGLWTLGEMDHLSKEDKEIEQDHKTLQESLEEDVYIGKEGRETRPVSQLLYQIWQRILRAPEATTLQELFAVQMASCFEAGNIMICTWGKLLRFVQLLEGVYDDIHIVTLSRENVLTDFLKRQTDYIGALTSSNPLKSALELSESDREKSVHYINYIENCVSSYLEILGRSRPVTDAHKDYAEKSIRDWIKYV